MTSAHIEILSGATIAHQCKVNENNPSCTTGSLKVEHGPNVDSEMSITSHAGISYPVKPGEVVELQFNMGRYTVRIVHEPIAKDTEDFLFTPQ